MRTSKVFSESGSCSVLIVLTARSAPCDTPMLIAMGWSGRTYSIRARMVQACSCLDHHVQVLTKIVA